jgi:ribosomal protein S18 acetylase RimI-like enzyme
MLVLDSRFRHAGPEDANDMAEFVNMAGEGLPLYLWSGMADAGRSGWDIGRARARRDSGAFSWRNTILRIADGESVACLIGYPLADVLAPADYTAMPAMFAPLQRLEDQAPGTWYVNVLATREAFRGRGYARELLTLAERIAADLGKQGVSLIVADTNVRARSLYSHVGYREIAQQPMIKEQWAHPGRHWVLMLKAAAAA